MTVHLFWSLLVCIQPNLCAQDAQNRLLRQAREDANHGRYASAKAEIEQAIALDGNQAEPWYQLGLLYGQNGDYRGAEEAFRHSLRIDAHSAKAHCRLGQTLVAAPEVKEDWVSAVGEFRIALRLDPAYPEAESLLGLGLTHLGDRTGAITTLRHSIQQHPGQASAHLNLALALEQQPEGQDEAVEQYRAALAAKPEAPDTESSLGKLLLRMGRLSEAEQAFRHTLRLNPDLQDAHYGLARVLTARKQVDEAAIEFGFATALEQRRSESVRAIRLNNEAMQLAAKGDLPQAIAGLRRAILLKPDYGIAKYNLGLMLADSGDLSAAKDQLIQAVSLLPGHAIIWFDLGRVLSRTGEGQGAVEAVSWAARLMPGNSKFKDELNKLRSAGPYNQSGALLSATTTSKAGTAPSVPPLFGARSDTPGDRLAFARELRSKGDLPGATGELTRALELKPDAVEARIELAEIYASQARWEVAVQEYRTVLTVTGDEDANAQLALGDALLRVGRPVEAAAHFDRALEIKPDSTVAHAGLEEAHRLAGRP